MRASTHAMNTESGMLTTNCTPQIRNVLAMARGMRSSVNATRQFSSPHTAGPTNMSRAVLKLRMKMSSTGQISTNPSGRRIAAM